MLCLSVDTGKPFESHREDEEEELVLAMESESNVPECVWKAIDGVCDRALSTIILLLEPNRFPRRSDRKIERGDFRVVSVVLVTGSIFNI